MRIRIRVIVEYVAAFVVILLLVTAITGVVVVKFHGEALKEYFLDEVNERIDTRIDIGSISVKVFSKFPNTSILIEDITVWSSHNFNRQGFQGSAGADTMATAETVSVSFNLLGMIRKKFNIREIEIGNGSLMLLTDAQGQGNYRMFKPAGEKGSREGSFSISQVNIHDFRFRIDNRVKQLKAHGMLENLELNGKFSKRNSQVKTSMRGTLGELSNKGVLYASHNHVAVRLNMDLSDSVYTLKMGNLQIDRISADVDGRFTVRPGNGVQLDLVAAARNLEIHEVLDLFPVQLSNDIKRIRGNGNLQVYTRVTGPASSTLTPRIEADFQAANANLFWEKVPFSLKNLNISGTYSNGGRFNPVTTSLIIESVSTVIGKDHISGSASIKNFLDPDFRFELKGELHPAQWLEWYGKIPIDQVAGTIYSDLKVSGAYDRGSPKGERFQRLDITGGVSLEEVLLRITRGGIPFESLNGRVTIDNDTWEPSLKGRFGKSDFSISGTGRNLLSYLTGDNQPLIASADFRSNKLDLSEVLSQLPGNKEDTESAIKFPDNLDLRLDFAITDFAKDMLLAKNVRGVAYYDSPFFYVDSLTMQTMEGTLTGSFGMTQNAEGHIFTRVNASLYKLDISQLFKAFNNFGQNQLTSRHLKGTISGLSAFSAEFDPFFRINPGTILSENNITIRDGELNEFTPLLALSRFIEVEELKSVRFQALQNNIVVKDRQVMIPAMEIHSNALDLSASGTHNFDNTYDYRLTLKLSELLYNKARKGSHSNEFKVAEDESDTRTLFLKVFDDGSGSHVEIDREQTAKKVREDLRNERTELKQILNEELGLFKDNRELKDAHPNQEHSEEFLRFEFREDTATVAPDRQDERKTRRERRLHLKKDTAQTKPAEKFVIDE